MGDDGNRPGREGPANDNCPPDGQGAGQRDGASERLDAVVLTIARLIGRRMAREDYEKARCAANDNAPPNRDGSGKGADDTE
ncbi:hypothetical protein SAMN04244581_04354 [Paracoccus denitrificans]|jgi:hypothetical protein|nr:hypothetical protein [Paracoccus denitrificans]GEK71188.1 hypothetical protein PDE01_47080 [Paracoccus denitrificans]SDJ60109.1 hypothetical protein SAMN04244581_04354 [Paracoccus denitrificans]SFR20106.1 hypothetical protein SAMN04244569_04304 [Paracoccus denitrificans]